MENRIYRHERSVLEVEVHQQLKALLREQGETGWPHHLTVARLVARALRLQRGTLMQVSSTAAYQGQHRLSYLAALLLWSESVILVATPEVQHVLCHSELPRLRDWLAFSKPVYPANTWPGEGFTGILLLSPQDWLRHYRQPGIFPPGVPVVVDGVEHLENWMRSHLTQVLTPQDWDALPWICPDLSSDIRNLRAALTHEFFQHPPNPYGSVMVENAERLKVCHLCDQLQTAFPTCYPGPWRQFADALHQDNGLVWATLDRQQGTFTLHSAPTEVATSLSTLWQGRTPILFSGVVELETQTDCLQQQLGLGALTSVQFTTDRQNEALSLYMPDGLPMPNTAAFATALLQQLAQLLTLPSAVGRFSVFIVDDRPLKTKVAAVLAAEFGSRVKVENRACEPGDVLVTGWTFWLDHQRALPTPHQLAIATLPFPSLENPQVAGRVAYYKQQRRDWFRLYLLPEALRTLQQAIAPLRKDPASLIALFDNRVLHRSYGQQVLAALSPHARLNYLDEVVLSPPQYTV